MNDRQRKFIEAYMIDPNATKAAKKAGFKQPHVAGCRLLKNVKVKAEIKKRQKARADKSKTSSEWVIDNLKENHELARSDDDIGQSTRALELIGKHHGTFNADDVPDKAITINIKMPDRSE